MRELIKNINRIIEDNVSGSITILNSTIESIEQFCIRNKSQDKEIINNILIDQLIRLFYRHSNFLGLFHFSNTLFIEIEKARKKKNTLDINKFLESYKDKWFNISILLANTLSENFELSEKKILLHSNSSTVQMVLSEVIKNTSEIEIFQTISHPAKEGIVQANILADLGFHVNLIEDSAIGKFIHDIDYVIVGADVILGDKFINKIGTYLLSLACQKNSIPLIVVADTRKFIDSNNISRKILSKFDFEDQKPGNELISAVINNVYPQNYYFEFIPNELASHFLTEKGLFGHKELKPVFKSAKISEIFEI